MECLQHKERWIFYEKDSISEITFTGGEPTLNVPIIKKLVDYIKGSGIFLGSFFVATNGLEYNQMMVDVLNDLYVFCIQNDLQLEDMTAMEIKKYIGVTMKESLCGLAVSLDKYHNNIPAINLLKYRMLPYYGESKEHDFYEKEYYKYLLNEGRAKINKLGSTNISIRDIDTDLVDKDTLVIHGQVYIGADGNVSLDCDYSFESQDMYKIGNINEKDLYDILLETYIENI